VRPALLALLAATAVLYLWDLGASGWANSYYSAAVQAASKSWKALFFGSFDASSFITVDKPPFSLWVMGISARIFGVSSWSILVPEALMGVASVGLLYATVRRWASPAAGLLAGAVLALTPAAALMFRFNNPDALLLLLLVAAAYATVRATESGSTRWLVAAAALVGCAFNTKMLQAFLVVPALAATYAVAGKPRLLKRAWQLALAGLALVVSSGWWVAVVELWPASSRPYVGGSQSNSVLDLIFGYNGLGRITGNEAGSVGGGQAGSRWGETGWARLFDTDWGPRIAWLIPAAAIMIVVCLWLSRRGARTDRLRAAVLLWGGWFVVTWAVFSFGSGIIHSYYAVALAPALGALLGIGTSELWRRRGHLSARLALAGTLAATSVWSFYLLSRTPTWLPPLRYAVLVGGVAAAVALVLMPLATAGLSPARRRTAILAVVAAGVAASLAGPAAYTLVTASTPLSGSLPSAGPSVAGSGFGGPAGMPGAMPGAAGGQNGAPLAPPAGQQDGTGPGMAQAGQSSQQNATAGPPAMPSADGDGQQGQVGGATGQADGAADNGGGPGGGVGGLLNAGTPGTALVKLLKVDVAEYDWVLATAAANSAAGYQLATGEPIMAIGGFNGTDPAPTLAQFKAYVDAGRIHYYIAGGGMPGNGSSSASAIAQWVEDNFASETVDGVTVYDLTEPA
jgi:4-amino-4-deoxy-L-arabinose transferase-like glycosyltransferase